MGDEGTRGRAARDCLHHGSFDLDITPASEKIPYARDDPASKYEILPGLGINNEIHIALPIALLPVGKLIKDLPVLLLDHRQGSYALGEEHQVLRVHAYLSLLRPEQKAAHAYYVAEIKGLKDLVFFIAQIVQAPVDLDRTRLVFEMREAGLAHHSLRAQPAGHAHPGLLGLAVDLLGLRRAMRAPEPRRIGIDALFAERLDLVDALPDKLMHLVAH